VRVIAARGGKFVKRLPLTARIDPEASSLFEELEMFRVFGVFEVFKVFDKRGKCDSVENRKASAIASVTVQKTYSPQIFI